MHPAYAPLFIRSNLIISKTSSIYFGRRGASYIIVCRGPLIGYTLYSPTEKNKHCQNTSIIGDFRFEGCNKRGRPMASAYKGHKSVGVLPYRIKMFMVFFETFFFFWILNEPFIFVGSKILMVSL